MPLSLVPSRRLRSRRADVGALQLLLQLPILDYVLFWDSYLICDAGTVVHFRSHFCVPHSAPHVAITWVGRQVHGFDVPVAYMMCASPFCVLLWDQYLICDAGIVVNFVCQF